MQAAGQLVWETERLYLRELRASDWNAIYAYASDPEVVRYMDWGPYSEQETQDFVKRVLISQERRPRTLFELAAWTKAENQLVGDCGISAGRASDRDGELGYAFAQQYWRKGYATEAARGLLAFAFSSLGLHRVYATCDTTNLSSVSVLNKIGMYCEGHLREHKWHRDRWRDSYLYAVLEQEWRGPTPVDRHK